MSITSPPRFPLVHANITLLYPLIMDEKKLREPRKDFIISGENHKGRK